MPEYGNATRTELDTEKPTHDFLAGVKQILDFNYRATKALHPEWNLPEEWEFRVGPVAPAYEYGDCPACHGDGQWTEYDLEDDDVFELVTCEECDGMGMIAVRLMDPPQWVHQFGWYVEVT